MALIRKRPTTCTVLYQTTLLPLHFRKHTQSVQMLNVQYEN